MEKREVWTLFCELSFCQRDMCFPLVMPLFEWKSWKPTHKFANLSAQWAFTWMFAAFQMRSAKAEFLWDSLLQVSGFLTEYFWLLCKCLLAVCFRRFRDTLQPPRWAVDKLNFAVTFSIAITFTYMSYARLYEWCATHVARWTTHGLACAVVGEAAEAPPILPLRLKRCPQQRWGRALAHCSCAAGGARDESALGTRTPCCTHADFDGDWRSSTGKLTHTADCCRTWT